MVSDGYEIYQNDHLVSYIISNHWGVHLKLMQYCISTVNWKIKNDLKNKCGKKIKKNKK